MFNEIPAEGKVSRGIRKGKIFFCKTNVKIPSLREATKLLFQQADAQDEAFHKLDCILQALY